MNKEKLNELLKEKQAKIDELVARSQASENIDELKAINTQLEGLKQEISELRKLEDDALQQEARSQSKATILATYGLKKEDKFHERQVSDEEKRAEAFVASNKINISIDEVRAITIGSGDLVSPKPVQTSINEKFNEVSSIIEQVNTVSAERMGEYEVPYVVGYSEGGIITEGQDYSDGEPVFNYASIKPVKITIYTEVSEEVTKLTPVQYFAKVRQAALIALRKKVAKLIPLGNPNSTPAEITGIIHAPAITDGSLELTAIDENTLRRIALAYGGDENVVGNAILLINKLDLIAFGDVRGADKKSVYEITPDTSNPNAGIIKEGGLSVRYIINSALPAVSVAATPATSTCMIYGNPNAYELALFSPYEIKVSEDAAFKKGMLAVRGSVFVGGNVVTSNGFVLIEKKAT
ncbi:MAG: phage major capsid protein [Erysipelotrichia bacterium]|jgi:HK97 family phage major capsid protein|nr:phage major capsid protein [Erysipelotrichia bacterium]